MGGGAGGVGLAVVEVEGEFGVGFVAGEGEGELHAGAVLFEERADGF